MKYSKPLPKLFFGFALFVCNSAWCQSLVNSTGSSLVDSKFSIEYSIGEISITTINSNPNAVTQGLLQPILKFKDCNLLALIPNAFSPNSDNVNDCFALQNWPAVSFFSLTVYNRWGQVVFQTNNKIECWNGEMKGKPQPSGVYVYSISAITEACGKLNRKGTLLLIR